jgi:hypothetical protein
MQVLNGKIESGAGGVISTFLPLSNQSTKEIEMSEFNLPQSYNSTNLADKFWPKVDKAGEAECWEWKGRSNHAGYGTLTWSRKSLLAHRVAFLLTHGPFPQELLILHSCDNRPCCNPRHLRVGTHQDNAKDMVERDRQSKCEHRPNAKLTNDLVPKIFDARDEGLSHSQIGRKFGISTSQVTRVLQGNSWSGIGAYRPTVQNLPVPPNFISGAKIGPPEVRTIRRMVAEGLKDKEIASCVGLSISQIYAIRIGRCWKYIT